MLAVALCDVRSSRVIFFNFSGRAQTTVQLHAQCEAKYNMVYSL